MSPFMAIIVLVVLTGVGVLVVGLVMRKRKVILVGAPSALAIVIWFSLANSRPNSLKEFDRLFGAENRDLASDIRTIKPTLMDGHFVSFHMRQSDFDAHVRARFSAIELASPPNILIGQKLPAGWPAALESATAVLYREIEHQDVYLVYLPSQEMAYASVRYEQW